MTFIVFLLCVVIGVSGGFLVGYVAGRMHERELARLRRPLAPHEVLAQLRGPLPGGRR